MEDPSTWKMADKIANDAYQDWWAAHNQGMAGLSVGRYITDALRHHGYISDTEEPAIDWAGLRSKESHAEQLRRGFEDGLGVVQ